MPGLILWTTANAVLPIVLLIAFGYLLRQRNVLCDEYLRLSSKLVFHCFIPCMLFINVYNIETIDAINWEIVCFCVLMLGVFFVLGIGTAVFTTAVPNRRGVILQCVFRSNFAIIGLPLAGALGGDEASAAAAVISAFAIPVFNILAVISLSIFIKGEKGERKSIRLILLSIVKNPLIIGVVLGLVCLMIRSAQIALFGEVAFSLQRDMRFIYTTLDHLQSITSPFALLVMGGQFRFSAVHGMFREIAVGTIWRIVLAPALGIGTAIALAHFGILSCGPAEYPALIALFGSPVAVSSAIMAEGMKNDAQLATQLVVWTSIGSIATIFVSTGILMMFGFLAV